MSEAQGSEHSEAALGAWLVDRLTQDRAREEWRENLVHAWRHLLERPLSRVLPRAEVEALLQVHLADEAQLEALACAMARGAMVQLVRDLREDSNPVGRFLPDEARRRLLALVSEPRVVHAAWITRLFKEPAIEGLVSETLYRALIDFSTIVPRLLQSMTPLGRFAKLGGFGEGGLGTRLVEEVEKRLEPEIRRFLEAGTRKALDGAARFSIDRLDEPTSRELRRNMLSFALDETGSFHAFPFTDARVAELEAIARETARHLARSDELKQRLSKRVAEIAEAHGERPLSAVLSELGLTQDPPFEAWASASFPVLIEVLRTPAVTAWFGRVGAEMLAQFGSKT